MIDNNLSSDVDTLVVGAGYMIVDKLVLSAGGLGVKRHPPT